MSLQQQNTFRFTLTREISRSRRTKMYRPRTRANTIHSDHYYLGDLLVVNKLYTCYYSSCLAHLPKRTSYPFLCYVLFCAELHYVIMGDSRAGRRVTIAASPERSNDYDDYTDIEDQARLFQRQNSGRRFSAWVSYLWFVYLGI